jgi:aldehyde dehydrogenase (NAD+)
VALGEERMLIDGKLVESSSGATFDNVNPATEQVIGVAADATVDDARAAVEAARRAFDETDWATDHAFRARCLRQLKEAMVEARQALSDVLVAEAGSPVSLGPIIQLDLPVNWLDHWATTAETYPYEAQLEPTKLFGATHRGVQRREPIGVVTAITPFNYPIFVNIAKIGPALAAGDTVVLKPSPDTPWSATMMGRLAAEKTDIPPGVFNVVTSSSIETSEALTTDPRVDMITFTGSTATGRRIMHSCADTVKKCFLELGGKSANIVLDDADFGLALALAAGWVCTHSGQGCAAYTRLLLPRSRYDEGVEIAKGHFERARVGDPTDPTILHGPQINKRQQEKVLGLIQTGVNEGARLLLGGGVPPDLPRGYYVQPTLFTDVKPDHTIAQEEFFGPVLVVIPYDDEDDAVEIANNSIYGLSGSVWSVDEERALRVARRMRTGTVSINGSQWLDKTRAFGGYKQSGVGRENGIEGFEEYMETKVVSLPG